MALSSSNLSGALIEPRNLYYPNVKVKMHQVEVGLKGVSTSIQASSGDIRHMTCRLSGWF